MTLKECGLTKCKSFIFNACNTSDLVATITLPICFCDVYLENYYNIYLESLALNVEAARPKPLSSREEQWCGRRKKSCGETWVYISVDVSTYLFRIPRWRVDLPVLNTLTTCRLTYLRHQSHDLPIWELGHLIKYIHSFIEIAGRLDTTSEKVRTKEM